MTHDDRMTLFLGFLLALMMLVFAVTLGGCAKGDEDTEIPKAPHPPLDAIEYDPPEWFPTCQTCLKVTDGVTGKSWWMLRIYGESRWIVLEGAE